VPQTRRNLRGKAEEDGSITLAVVTRDRPGALAQFLLQGLNEVAGAGFPVVVVDQSNGPKTAALVEQIPRARYLRSAPGLARGRNVAVRGITTPLLAFTDDDVTLPGGWLDRILEVFECVPDAGAVCGRALTPEGVLLPGSAEGTYRWPVRPFGLGSGFNIAFRREALESVGPFDEELGAGARFRAGEDTDMLYRLLRAGYSVVCSDEISVVHHDERRGRQELRLHYGYGLGAGAQTVKHLAEGDRAALRLLAAHAGRHLVTLGRAAVTVRPSLAGLQVAYLAGVVAGLARGRNR
jgi:hypothetical protein